FYTCSKGTFSYIERKPIRIYSKNSLTWDDTAKIGSFITSQEEVISSFARTAISHYKRKMLNGFNKKLQEALIIFDSLGALGISYASDPQSGYRSGKLSSIDFVMFPRETLSKKAGDCDDLTVLYSSLLENIGIKTAVVTIPGHIFMMFDTEVPENNYTDISSEKNSLYFMNGTVWVPIEVTMIGKSFCAAWKEGANHIQKYHTKTTEFNIIETSSAWNRFPSADIGPGEQVAFPSKQKIDVLFELDLDEIKTKSFDQPVRELTKKLDGPFDYEALNGLGMLHGKHGMLDMAFTYLKKAIEKYPNRAPAYVNLGNIYFLKNEYEKALPLYEKAVALNPENHKYRLSLARALFETGKRFKAKEEYQQALKGNPGYSRRYAYLDSDPQTRAADPAERAGYNMWIMDPK
ncbi:MAG: tetratricopeptide repeat protein, partial [Spirochaetes bacterium]|nr:tetratricopeptide repeat protein [Spirochaetota bacterium]